MLASSSMATAAASEVAKAENSLLRLSSRDQDALLDVLQDCFTSPEDEDLDNLDGDPDTCPQEDSLLQ